MASRDSAIIEKLIVAHEREVYGLLVSSTRNRMLAEDLTQEVFLLAHRKGVTPGPGMRTWLREVARRLSFNELRRRRPAMLGPEQLAAAADGVAVSAAKEAEDATFEDELAALRKCLEPLSHQDRALLEGRYGTQRALKDLASALGSSEGYMKKRLFILRGRLARCIRRRIDGGATSG